MKQPCVYLLSSSRNGTLYLGVTSNVVGRVWQHREHLVAGFSDRYEATRLVWFEQHESMESALHREKRINEVEPCMEGAVDRRIQSVLA